MRSTRSEALRTIQYLIPAGSEDIRMVRKLQPKRCTRNHIVAMQYKLNEHHHQVAHVFIFFALETALLRIGIGDFAMHSAWVLRVKRNHLN